MLNLYQLYEQFMQLENAYKNAETREEKLKHYECYREWWNRLEELGSTYAYVVCRFCKSKKAGNGFLDVDGDECATPEELATVFHELGITQFTFSSTWSGALVEANRFTKCGYHLIGMTEIYTKYKDLDGNIEKAPALVFSED